jgi:hypothetical protein
MVSRMRGAISFINTMFFSLKKEIILSPQIQRDGAKKLLLSNVPCEMSSSTLSYPGRRERWCMGDGAQFDKVPLVPFQLFSSKELSQEMDLAFKDMHGQFQT